MYLSSRADAEKIPLGSIAPAPIPFKGPNARLAGIPSGRAGTIATLNHMRDYVRDAIRSPEQTIRNKALEILTRAQVPPRKYMRELAALHAFVRDQIRYVRDPVGVELVQRPEVTLQNGQGDCDDKSTLLASLLMATGHPAKFTVVAFNGKGFSHVLTESKAGNRWIPAETIIDKPLGWFPPGVTDKYSKDI